MAALPNDEEVVIRIENPVDEDVIETSTDTVELATEQLTPTKQPPLDADLIRQLMERIAILEHQNGKLPSGNDDNLDDEDLDNVSVMSSKIDEFTPKDHGRWKTSKSQETARNQFIDQLKGLDIGNKEENWFKFESIFQIVMKSLDLTDYVIEPELQTPMSHTDMKRAIGNNNSEFYTTNIAPYIKTDTMGHMYHPNFPDVEIVSEDERSRFENNYLLLYSIITTCTNSSRLDSVMSRDHAREQRDIAKMYKYLKAHFVQITGSSMTQRIVKLMKLAHYNPEDRGLVKALETLRESKRVLKELSVSQELLYVSIFLAALEPGSAIKDRLNVLVNEKGEETTLDEVAHMYQTWYRDHEIQQQNDSTFRKMKMGKAPRDVKTNLLTVEQKKIFGKCTKDGICYNCYITGKKDIQYKDCITHRKPKKIRLVKIVPAYSATVNTKKDLRNLLLEATEATDGIAEEIDLTALYYHDDLGNEEPNQVAKTNAVLLIDSGAAQTTVPSTVGLSNVKQLCNPMSLEYANGDKGTPIDSEGTLVLNGRQIRALVSPDLHDGLISTSQLDIELNATTVQMNGKSISFVPNDSQRKMLRELVENMDSSDVLAEANLNDDGLYEVTMSNTSKALSVSVFPRVAANTLTQAVYLLHASLGHMPKDALISLAKNTMEEENPNPMVKNWPSALTAEVIGQHFPSCKACMTAQQKKIPFATERSPKSPVSTNSQSKDRPSTPGELGQVDMWGPYPTGRGGNTHLFTIVDAFSSYMVSIPCVNKPGENPKLLKQVLGIFLSFGVKFKKIVGDGAFNTASCKHVLHTMYGNEGIQFSLAVPDEHETNGIIERAFSTIQRRATANLLTFLEDSDVIQFVGLDAMVYATYSLNHTSKAKFNFAESSFNCQYRLSRFPEDIVVTIRYQRYSAS